MLCSYERLFVRTANKHILLEMILLRICQKGSRGNEPTSSSPVSQQSAAETVILDHGDEPVPEDDEDSDVIDELPEESQGGSCAHGAQNDQWACFVAAIEELHDPLLLSVFRHGVCKHYDPEAGVLSVAFAKQFVFFQEWLSSSVASWKPLLDRAYAKSVIFNPVFTDEIAPVVIQQRVQDPERNGVKMVEKAHAQCYQNSHVKVSRVRGIQVQRQVDTKDAQLWPKTAMILQYFPGVVRQY
jgi:hypothetical protein